MAEPLQRGAKVAFPGCQQVHHSGRLLLDRPGHHGREQLLLRLEVVQVRRSTATLMRERQTQGLKNEGAAQRALAAAFAAEAELAAVEEGIALTRDRFTALMGKGPDRGVSTARLSPAALVSPGLPTNLPAELLGRRPDVTAARLRVEAAARRIDVAEAAFYPNINLAAFCRPAIAEPLEIRAGGFLYRVGRCGDLSAHLPGRTAARPTSRTGGGL